MTIDAKKDYVAIGQLAGQLRVTVRAIERAAVELELPPAMRINGVPYMDAAQIETLTAHLRVGGVKISIT